MNNQRMISEQYNSYKTEEEEKHLFERKKQRKSKNKWMNKGQQERKKKKKESNKLGKDCKEASKQPKTKF